VTAWILLEIDVHDPDTYRRYMARTPELVARFGGRFLVRGQAELLEGEPPPRRVVLVEFPDAQSARALWESPEYRELAAIRQASARARVLLLHGVDEPVSEPPPPGCGSAPRP